MPEFKIAEDNASARDAGRNATNDDHDRIVVRKDGAVIGLVRAADARVQEEGVSLSEMVAQAKSILVIDTQIAFPKSIEEIPQNATDLIAIVREKGLAGAVRIQNGEVEWALWTPELLPLQTRGTRSFLSDGSLPGIPTLPSGKTVSCPLCHYSITVGKYDVTKLPRCPKDNQVMR